MDDYDSKVQGRTQGLGGLWFVLLSTESTGNSKKYVPEIFDLSGEEAT